MIQECLGAAVTALPARRKEHSRSVKMILKSQLIWRVEMPKNRQAARRPLPKLLLLPLPTGLKKMSRSRRPVAMASPALDIQQDTQFSLGNRRMLIQGVLDDLWAVVALVRSFLVGDAAQVQESIDWLHDLASEIESVDQDIEAGYLDGAVRIDDISGLDEILDRRPVFEDVEEGGIDAFASNMLCFWLDEVERRGREVIDIAIMAVSLQDACDVGNALRSMRYPIC